MSPELILSIAPFVVIGTLMGAILVYVGVCMGRRGR